MKDNHDHTLKDVFKELIKSYKWEDKLDEVKLINSWEKIVGKMIADHTTRMTVKNRVLYINLDSSVIRNELMMARSKIVEAINKEMGAKVIDDLVLR
jgi:predicted nucleic acid-binding Zn ribbon protein